MHKKKLKIEKEEDSSGILHRGKLIYYIGSMLFIIGISLVVIACGSVLYFNIHYGSEKEIIFHTITFFGIGFSLTILGINLMIRQKTKGYIFIAISSFISLIAIILFMLNYRNNWYYPIISYILVLYITGSLILIGNLFANVILSIIEKKAEPITYDMKPTHLYTDEEIMKDIEEATRQSLEAAAAGLQIEFEDTGEFKPGKSFSKIKTRGTVKRIKDDINESADLQKTIHPGDKEKWGSVGIDKASIILNKTLTEKKSKKRLFSGFKDRKHKKSKKKRKLN